MSSNSDDSENIYESLKLLFGHSKFKNDLQKNAIETILKSKVMVIFFINVI